MGCWPYWTSMLTLARTRIWRRSWNVFSETTAMHGTKFGLFWKMWETAVSLTSSEWTVALITCKFFEASRLYTGPPCRGRSRLTAQSAHERTVSVLVAFWLCCDKCHACSVFSMLSVKPCSESLKVVDFLGVTTTWRAACGDLDQGEPHLFLAPGRSLDCLYAISGRPLRNWPLLDEEYLEWADVLHAASSAATRPGTGLRMAEIGAGRIGIWGIRAAKAFLRLKQDMGTHTSCDILLVEPFDLGSGLDLKNHILRNLPEGRCRITVKTDPARTAEDLKSLLSGEEPWDLVDIDAQGAEHGLLQGLTSWLAQRVRRLHVSTHTRRIHANIRHWLAEGGWTILAENGFYSAAQQHLGRFVAVDGHISATPSQYHGQNKHGWGGPWVGPGFDQANRSRC